MSAVRNAYRRAVTASAKGGGIMIAAAFKIRRANLLLYAVLSKHK
jgi:hypothetical protein